MSAIEKNLSFDVQGDEDLKIKIGFSLQEYFKIQIILE